MAKITISERKAKLEAQLKALEKQEKENENLRLSALGAGLQSAFDADPSLKSQVMSTIEKNLKNNKQREVLGFEKITKNRVLPEINA